ncbi:phenylalanine--tRNA ligase subunit beta [bacterium]|nr:phenylalanine--tRNA ligase subunit beta [bacterium]
MKISLSWVFDHIDVSFASVDISKIITVFSERCAELNGVQYITFDAQQFDLAQVKALIQDESVVVLVHGHNDLQTLPFRKDVLVGQSVFVKKQDGHLAWATLTDFGSLKEGLFAPVSISDEQKKQNAWADGIALQDCILDVDNKSINHRPDMWSHRGIARELCACLGYRLKSLDEVYGDFSTFVSVEHASTLRYKSRSEHGVGVVLEEPDMMYRITVSTQPEIIVQNYPSFILPAVRLAVVDSRPLNALIDFTNYVMFDLGQPMHVFDARNVAGHTLVARRAKDGEKLELLDGKIVDLSGQDLVLADTEKVLSVAGIMGGKDSGVSLETTSIMVESAGYNPADIRMTAARLKIRTESSARFEKFVDPMQNTIAVQAYYALLKKYNLIGNDSIHLVEVGQEFSAPVITLRHARLEQLLGHSFTDKQVISILQSLQFGVLSHGPTYTVTVPTFRATKDIKIEEDLIEEIGRVYGFNALNRQLPRRLVQTFSVEHEQKMRMIKDFFSQVLRMHETKEYAFYDESFVQRLDWYPHSPVAIHNPVSENWKVLVTSLVPHLLKGVEINSVDHDQVRLFECNAVWNRISDKDVEEQMCSGIWFDKHAQMSFYDLQAYLMQLFSLLQIPAQCVPSQTKSPWFAKYQVADLVVDGKVFGTFGVLDPYFYEKIVKGHAVAFELHVQAISQYVPAKKVFMPGSKYQKVVHDVSVMLPYTVSVASMLEQLQQAHQLITQVILLDSFEKPEWKEQRSLTFRYTMQHEQKTLHHADIAQVEQAILQIISQKGGTVRT